MLIKVNGDRYLNSDHIIMIAPDPNTPGDYIVLTSDVNADPVQISGDAAHYIFALEGLTDNGFSDAPPVVLPLTDRLAIFLRDSNQVYSLSDLQTFFPNDVRGDLILALSHLIASNTVLSDRQQNELVYFHTSHNIKTEW